MTITTGPRPLTEDELDAVALCLQRVPPAEAAARTGLSLPQVAAAVDQARRMAQDVLPRTVPERSKPPAIAAPPTPTVAVAERSAPVMPDVLMGVGGSITHLRPAAVRELPAPKVTAVVPKPRPAPRPAPVPPTAKPSAPAVLEPGTKAWNRLATSEAVRDWATADGWQLPPPATRLPGAIVRAYIAANGDTP